MKLQNIRLQNFRSYQDQTYDFNESITIISGPNASGKTNLLESILLLCSGSTYRTSDILDLVNKNSDWARIDGKFDKSQRTIKIKDNKKVFIIDDKEIVRFQSKYILPTVLFEPSQLQLLTYSPEMRRSLVDDILSQINHEFMIVKKQYLQALRQRNSLLKTNNIGLIKSQIFAWNIRLSELASQYVQYRLKIIEEINKTLSNDYSEIAGSKFDVEIKYNSATDLSTYASAVLHALDNNLEKDIARGFTGSGPHRDDIIISINKKPLKAGASRGEVRTTLLAIKLAEAYVIEKALSVKPILLLDDVYGELDTSRRNKLLKKIETFQVLITTSEISNKDTHTLQIHKAN